MKSSCDEIFSVNWSIFLFCSTNSVCSTDSSCDREVKPKTLLSSIEDAILIIDYPGPLPYTTSGGILFGNFLNANVDELDLRVPFTPFTRYTDMLYPGERPLKENYLPPPNPAIKMLVINYCSKGYPGTFFAQQLPTLVVWEQLRSKPCVRTATIPVFQRPSRRLPPQ